MNTEPTLQHLSPDELANVAWHISTYSDNGGGSCVEAGPLNDGTGRIAMRHSHHPHSTTIVSPHHAWTAFTAAVRGGEFGLR
ncbi:DUF397 domain-containing protein [Salinactinospora qingdaonensis]|uniref:DUF397 domain-containing protein n=1 Tax=Salinactinospora qingdaonensis TaxID=702744 RepID=A0ABP7FW92_9ACTN